jgi:LemA protein
MNDPWNANASSGFQWGKYIPWAILALLVFLVWTWTVSARNVLVRHSNEVEATFAGINNAAKKRADLIPNLVATVERFAQQEKDVFVGVTQARASATKITLPENATPEQLEKFAQAQSQLSGALGRLLAVVENYPQLKSDTSFLNLQKELKDAEMQMSAARARYIGAVKGYNVNVQSCPNACIAASLFGFQAKPQLDFGENAEQNRNTPPKVDFKKS